MIRNLDIRANDDPNQCIEELPLSVNQRDCGVPLGENKLVRRRFLRNVSRTPSLRGVDRGLALTGGGESRIPLKLNVRVVLSRIGVGMSGPSEEEPHAVSSPSAANPTATPSRHRVLINVTSLQYRPLIDRRRAFRSDRFAYSHALVPAQAACLRTQTLSRRLVQIRARPLGDTTENVSYFDHTTSPDVTGEK